MSEEATEQYEEQEEQQAPPRNGGNGHSRSVVRRDSLIPEPVQMLANEDPRKGRYLEAMMVCNANFITEGARGSVASTYLLMTRAATLKLPWDYAVTVMYMTPDGKLGMETQAIIAVLLRDGFKIEWRETTPDKATVYIERPREEGQEKPFGMEATWTKKDADGIMIYAKGGQKPLTQKFNWAGDKNRQVMLRYRAFMECVRLVAPDKIGGLMSEDELADAWERLNVIDVTPVTVEQMEESSGAAAAHEIDPEIIPPEEETRLRKAFEILKGGSKQATEFLLALQGEMRGRSDDSWSLPLPKDPDERREKVKEYRREVAHLRISSKINEMAAPRAKGKPKKDPMAQAKADKPAEPNEDVYAVHVNGQAEEAEPVEEPQPAQAETAKKEEEAETFELDLSF